MKKKQVSLRKSHPWSASHLYQFLVWAGQTVAAEEVSQGESVAINNDVPLLLKQNHLWKLLHQLKQNLQLQKKTGGTKGS